MSRPSSALQRAVRALPARLWVSLPDRIPLVALAAFLVVSATTTFGVFRESLVLPAFGLTAVAFVVLLGPRAVAPTKAARWGTAAALLMAALWFVVNVPFVAEWLDPNRDPGLYLAHGLWFAAHPESAISIVPAQRIAAHIPGLTGDLGAIHGGATGLIAIQGGDLLPGLVGGADWIAGLEGALTVNLLLGAIGLVGLYGFARRVIGPVWALAAELALALSVAYIYFSRGTYSEIIMVVVGLGALTWLLSGLRAVALHGRRRGRARRVAAWFALVDFAVAGVFVGVATSARIDGVLVGVGALAALGAAGLALVPKADRRRTLVGGLVFAAFGAGSTLFGIYALVRNKASYVTALGTPSKLLWLAALAAVAVVVVLWIVGRVVPDRRLHAFWRVAAPVVGGLVVVVMLFWLSRPLWYVGHFAGAAGFSTIEGLQKAAGVALDGTRSYEEQTLSWVGWYQGWPLVGLATVGLAVCLWAGIRRRRLALVVAASAPLVVMAVYFTNVSITPDQIWAYRRLLPVITPGLIVAALVPGALLWQAKPCRPARETAVTARGEVTGIRKSRFAKPGQPRPSLSGWVLRPAAVVAAFAVALTPLAAWNGLLAVKDGGGQVGLMSSICDAVGDSKEVLLIRDGAPANYALSIKTVCRVEVVSVWSFAIKDGNLATLHDRVGDIPVIGFLQDAMPYPRRSTGADDTVIVPTWSRTLTHLPTVAVETERTLYTGTLQADGSVVGR